MNTSPGNLRWHKRIARKQKLHERAMKGVSARERLRMERAASEPLRAGKLRMKIALQVLR